MRLLALLAIRFYQRYLSPYKGFCCAYGAYTGHASCSALGYRAVRRFGVLHGVKVLDGRLAKCGVAHRRYSALNRQAGFCDLSCDLPCDPSCASPCEGIGGGKPGVTGGLLDTISGCLDIQDCCDWRKRKRDRQADERTHVPPRRSRRQRGPGER